MSVALMMQVKELAELVLRLQQCVQQLADMQHALVQRVTELESRVLLAKPQTPSPTVAEATACLTDAPSSSEIMRVAKEMVQAPTVNGKDGNEEPVRDEAPEPEGGGDDGGQAHRRHRLSRRAVRPE